MVGFYFYTAKEIAKENLSAMRTFFGNELDISDELIVVNGRLGQSNEMKDFKTILRDTTNEIKVGGLRVFYCVFCLV